MGAASEFPVLGSEMEGGNGGRKEEGKSVPEGGDWSRLRAPEKGTGEGGQGTPRPETDGALAPTGGGWRAREARGPAGLGLGLETRPLRLGRRTGERRRGVFAGSWSCVPRPVSAGKVPCPQPRL